MAVQYVLERQTGKPFKVRVYCPVRETWIWRDMQARRRDVAEREARSVVAAVLLQSSRLAHERAAATTRMANELAAEAGKLDPENLRNALNPAGVRAVVENEP